MVFPANQLYSWGVGTSGVLGLEIRQDDFSEPKVVKDYDSAAGKIVQIAIGRYHVALRVASGRLYIIGRNEVGELSRDDQNTRFEPVSDLGYIFSVACCSRNTIVLRGKPKHKDYHNIDYIVTSSP